MKKEWLTLLLVTGRHHHPAVSLALEAKEILQLEENQKIDHYTGQSGAFVALLSDHFINIAAGKVDSPTREASLSRFNQYFSQVRIPAWENLREPVIRFSSDGSIAYVAVQKQVVTAFRDTGRQTQNDTTIFAWLAIY